MGSKDRSSGVAGAEVMFDMRGKGEGTIDGKAFSTCMSGRAQWGEAMTSTKETLWAGTLLEAGRGSDRGCVV